MRYRLTLFPCVYLLSPYPDLLPKEARECSVQVSNIANNRQISPWVPYFL